ncbi:B12-binding domain-containing radical SAM protein [Micromonospora sp. LOL_023]|uniref:B12-binding domain-containing radical SAM protein n=1 Tax=Micromonospora sp. LOL_023 TaxID=3345418 RepID=UPI003A8B5DB2
MSTSRGCAAHCSFCQSGNYGNRYHSLPRWRHRSAENIVRELVQLNNMGITAVSIVDDDFLGGDGRGVDRARIFIALLRASRLDIRFSIECRVDELDEELLTDLRQVGLRHVLIGVEAANDSDIRLFAKRTTNSQVRHAVALLRELRIDFSVGFIMFHPLSTVSGLEQNLNFLHDLRIGTYSRVTNRLELHPGAPLTNHYRRHGIVFYEENYRFYYQFSDPQVATAYAMFRELLRPFVTAETAGYQARFTAATAFDPADEKMVERQLGRLSERTSTALVEAAIECLQHAVSVGADMASSNLRHQIERTATGLTDSCRQFLPRITKGG